MDSGWVSIVIMTFLDHGFGFWHKRNLTPEQIQFLRPYYQGEYELEMLEVCKRDYESQL